jgi:hypothetical protein
VFCFGSITVPFIHCLKIPKQQDEKDKKDKEKEKEMTEMTELFWSSRDLEKKEKMMISLCETSNPSSPTTPPSFGNLLQGSASFEEKYIYPIVFSERNNCHNNQSKNKKNSVSAKKDSLQRGIAIANVSFHFLSYILLFSFLFPSFNIRIVSME